MTKSKLVRYQKRFKFSKDQLDYEFQLKKRRCWWWLLLCLLPLLLLIRCEHDITVTCIDERTKQPVQGINVELDYTAHFLYDEGHFFADVPVNRELVTDSEGTAVFEDLECSVFSYIFYCLSEVHVVADESMEKSALFHFTRHIIIELENIDCAVDIVMCIDNTGSMDDLISMVKSNALNFYTDLRNYCEKRRRNIRNVRLKVVPFGDLTEGPIIQSKMFVIPEEETEYQNFVNDITAEGGGDSDENGLEALAMAINTEWVRSDYRLRHIILLYTDASAHQLDNPRTHTGYYPPNMPKNMTELHDMWNKMDKASQRLVLFAPKSYPWVDIAEDWDNVAHKTDNLNTILTGVGYEEILEAICKSL